MDYTLVALLCQANELLDYEACGKIFIRYSCLNGRKK